jgi:hypothetical protein
LRTELRIFCRGEIENNQKYLNPANCENMLKILYCIGQSVENTVIVAAAMAKNRPQKVDKRMVLEHTHGLFTV